MRLRQQESARRSVEAEAIAAWNTRPTDPALAETVARLREALSDATSGPWKHSPWHIEEGEPAIRAPEGWIIANLSSDADAALIVEAINALPALLDAVEGKPKAAPERAPAKD